MENEVENNKKRKLVTKEANCNKVFAIRSSSYKSTEAKNNDGRQFKHLYKCPKRVL